MEFITLFTLMTQLAAIAIMIGGLVWLGIRQVHWERAFKQRHLGWCDGQRLYCTYPEYHVVAEPTCPKACGCTKHMNERAW